MADLGGICGSIREGKTSNLQDIPSSQSLSAARYQQMARAANRASKRASTGGLNTYAVQCRFCGVKDLTGQLKQAHAQVDLLQKELRRIRAGTKVGGAT